MTGARKDGDIKNSTSKMGGWGKLIITVKMTPEGNLHSQLTPTTDVKWTKFTETVVAGRRWALMSAL